MIYVSSASVKHRKIGDSIREIANHGFRHIELSGGTGPYPEMLEELSRLKSEYNLQYLVHNYFPPPEKAFVLNLASLDETDSTASLEHCLGALELARLVDSPIYGVHAGFFIKVNVEQIGKSISASQLYDRDDAEQKFVSSLEKLVSVAGSATKIYVENNVVSKQNFDNFGQVNPFMMTNADDYDLLSAKIDFGLILDMAHLYVSATTLGLDFKSEASRLLMKSDYIHISDNDGLRDSNECLRKDSPIAHALREHDLSDKIFTLEVYDGLEAVKESEQLLIELIHG